MTYRMEMLWQTSATNDSLQKASRAKRPIRGWKSPYPKPTNSLGCSRGRLRRGLGRSLLDPIKKSHKQPALVTPVVVAEHKFVQVRLKVLAGHAPVYAAYATLKVRPKALNRVRVNISTNVDLLFVVYAGVLVSHLSELVVRASLVRVDDRLGEYPGLDVRHKRLLASVVYLLDHDF